MIAKTPLEVFRAIATVQSRGLVQSRHVWRAILPHAIANRLAKSALSKIPYSLIEEKIVKNPSDRLLKSFSRRLGYLDDSSHAQAIVRKWLEHGGMLANLATLTETQKTIFQNIPPVSPEAVLGALDTTVPPQDQDKDATFNRSYARLLRSLAYDPVLFERSVKVLLKMAEAGGLEENSNEALGTLKSLFQPYLSGTHATIEQRLAIVKELLESEATKKQKIGQQLLHTMLEAGFISSHYDFSFGSRKRDYGYYPRTRAEAHTWYGKVLGYVESLVSADSPFGPSALATLYSDRSQKKDIEAALLSAGRELLRMFEVKSRNDREDDRIERLIKICLRSPADIEVVNELCQKLKDSVEAHETQPYHHDDMLEGLFVAQPHATLDAFFPNNEDDIKSGLEFFSRLLRSRKHPVDALNQEALISWCDQNPAVRYPIAASIIKAFEHEDDDTPTVKVWTETAMAILNRAPNRTEIAKIFIDRFIPMGWSGSRAAIIESNVRLLDALEDFNDENLSKLVASEKPRFAKIIEEERSDELKRHKARDERFED